MQNRHSCSTRLVAILVTLIALGACGDDKNTTAARADDFCATMETAAQLLGRNAGSQTPQANEARYGQLQTLLDRAQNGAPAALTDDITTFASAIDDFDTALAASGYDLDALFATAEGTKLAEDTSHALSPAIVQHLTGTCGLTLG